MSKINTTKYYDEFLRYFEMAKWQHHNCNLGLTPYEETPFDDDLIKNVFLYDVVERKFAGFNQLLLDMWYDKADHPYSDKLDKRRSEIIDSFSDTWSWSLEEWLFVFFVHRITGSGINYALSSSGYHNSILLHFDKCYDVKDMVEVIRSHDGPKFTSSGYQIAPFSKPKDPYNKGGDYYLCEILPKLVSGFAEHLSESKKDFRKLMEWLIDFNKSNDMRVFHFQYAATLADIADFFPKLLNTESNFFYGKNAIECLTFLAKKRKGQKKMDFLDSVMEQIYLDTGVIAYNAEDVACDSIRWIENYINPKADYSHLCMDSIWSSHTIDDHPFGRQKAMLKHGLIGTFNGKPHPSDDKIIKSAGMTITTYQDLVNGGCGL